MEPEIFQLWGISFSGAHLLILLGLLVVGLGLGLWLGRARRRTPGTSSPATRRRDASDDAFLKGLSYLMADHTDQAIEEFTRAVTLNSDTVETYVVLGNLFRQKGEIERAVRIRQNIIARPNLEAAVKLQAIYDLGLDYRKGGLFNRAAEAFEEVLNMDPQHLEAVRQVVSLSEEMRDWDNAYDSLKRLDKLSGDDNRPVLAHYKTERGKELMTAGQLAQAEEAFNQAINVYKGCLDAYLHLGDLELARGRIRKALSVWRKAVRLAPLHAHLVISRLAAAEDVLGQEVVDSFLNEVEPQEAEVTTLLAMAQYFHRHQKDDRALELLDQAVAKSPRRLDVHRLRGEILLSQGQDDSAIKAYDDLLAQIGGDWASYQCQHCGLVTHQLTWKCPRCLKWDTMTLREPTLA
ncbi:MAG: tetratricopeptide repeat protein [Desulfarculaceae bacterium]|jgi:lipopolysaccharide biosynthesis regulator YciM